MVSYKAKEVNIDKKKLGLDLVIVIDVSGSMSGTKIALVRETLLFIIDELKESDRLSLVCFDDQSRILTNLSPMTSEFKEKFKLIVKNEIYDRGSTNIKFGLENGFRVLLNRKY